MSLALCEQHWGQSCLHHIKLHSTLLVLVFSTHILPLLAGLALVAGYCRDGTGRRTSWLQKSGKTWVMHLETSVRCVFFGVQMPLWFVVNWWDCCFSHCYCCYLRSTWRIHSKSQAFWIRERGTGSVLQELLVWIICIVHRNLYQLDVYRYICTHIFLCICILYISVHIYIHTHVWMSPSTVQPSRKQHCVLNAWPQ